MPLTAPSEVTRRELSLRWIDDSGDFFSQNIPLRGGLSNETINSAVTAIAAASWANLYRWDVTDVHAAPENASAALDGEQNSVYDVLNILFKNESTKQSITTSIPAIRETVMDGDSDVPDNDNAVYIAARNAFDGLLPETFVPVSRRYSERREIGNQAFPA